MVGIPVGFLGPLEMYSFYLFSDGGRFHYEGFGFGSFMFGNIASQIIGYYLIAAMLIPVGYGHLTARRWARSLALTLLWFWLVVGAPLVVVAFFILAASKNLSVPAALIALVFLGLSYLLFPGLLIWFYQDPNVKRTFESKEAKSHWIEALPMPILVLCTLYGFYIVMLHILILFNGMYPVFGVFVFGLHGILLLDASIACLVCLIWGTWRQRMWAQGYHFAVLVGIPLLIFMQPGQSLSPSGSSVRHTYRDIDCHSDKERTWKTHLLRLTSRRPGPIAALTRCSSSP